MSFCLPVVYCSDDGGSIWTMTFKKKLKSNNSVAASTLRRELDPSTRPTKRVGLLLHLHDAGLVREADQGNKSA
jgi:hypothetical protein